MTGRVAALVPCHDDPQVADVVARTSRYVDEVLVVGDAPPTRTRRALDALAGEGVRVIHRPPPAAKGDALAFGAASLLRQRRRPDLVVFVDADGQHPPECIPAFVRAARHADVVIGSRRAQRDAMPVVRRIANDASSALLSVLTMRRLPDTQCGMRLLTAHALAAVPLPGGGFEAETRHLAAVARAGLRIAWVPIPAIYGDEHSEFRPLRDSVRVLAAALASSRPDRPRRLAAAAGRLRTGAAGRRAPAAVATARVPGARAPAAAPRRAGSSGGRAL